MPAQPPATHRSRERGITLVETVMTAAAVALVIGGALMLMLSSRHAYEVGGTQSSLQEVGRRMLDDVLADIRRSGLTVDGGDSYPAIYVRPLAPSEESERGDLIATMNYADVDQVDETLAYQGDGNRIERNRDREANEFVFQVPADLDGDGTPLDELGNMEWRPELVSYRIEVANNGVPWLLRVREVDGEEVGRTRVGPWVTNLTFDVVFNDRSMRFGTVAVVLYLEKRNGRGQTITSALEGAVVLRNTREL